MNGRYERQIILPEIGEKGQERLARSSVTVVGAGGLGSPALLYLAAAGVGRIGIVDGDVVSLSNLHRQVLFKTEDQGESKAELARKYLLELNPEITVDAFPCFLDASNIEGLLSGCDLIIDGTDNFAAKYLINDYCVMRGKSLVYGAINRFEGYVSVFGGKGPCCRCLFPYPPKEYVPDCTESGILGAAAGIIGTLQALEAVKHLLSFADLKEGAGNVAAIDLKTLTIRNFLLNKNPRCPVCSNEPQITELIEYGTSCASDIPEVAPQDLKGRFKDAMLLDVREPDEWQEGHIEKALHLPLSDLMRGSLPEFGEKNGDVVVYCRSGQRSKTAISILRDKTILPLYNLAGGFEAWKKIAGRGIG